MYKALVTTFYSILTVLLLLMQACTSTPEQITEEKQGDENLTLFSDAIEDYSLVMQKVIKTKNGDFRGIYLGQTPEEVRAIEDALHDETAEKYIRYILDIELDEAVDLEYYFKNNQLDSIGVTIYIAELEDRDQLHKELIGYYEQLFDVKTELLDGKWLIKGKKHLVLLQYGGNDQLPEINFSLYKD